MNNIYKSIINHSLNILKAYIKEIRKLINEIKKKNIFSVKLLFFRLLTHYNYLDDMKFKSEKYDM